MSKQKGKPWGKPPKLIPNQANAEDNLRLWQPGNCGTGALNWFLIRYPCGIRRGDRECLEDARGRLRRFGSHDAAERVARQLNAVMPCMTECERQCGSCNCWKATRANCS